MGCVALEYGWTLWKKMRRLKRSDKAPSTGFGW